jgi:2-polyprenyl-3-methyl-5-hydroxy-6-metoxy-1,4-benzoquinol methylase
MTSRPFRTAAAYYLRYRPGYPPELIDRLAEAAEVDGRSRVIDLGCGPGSLAIPLAAHAAEVVAVDAEPEMIVELSRAAPPNVRAVEARAEDVDESWGAFQLATIGRALHWLDAPIVLANLALITPTVALCSDNIPQSEVQSFALALANELIDEPLIERPKFRYADILPTSPFSDVETISIEVDRSWTADDLIGFVYSTAIASPERLGDRRAELERRIRAHLDGPRHERVRVDAVIGRRPGVESTRARGPRGRD